jgi:type IV fimbrial biogenesis protein FimT
MKTNFISPPMFLKQSARTRANAGFTLIELLVVIAIVAIISMVAIPSFSRLIASTAVSGHVNTFMADAEYARSKARNLRAGGGVTMCRSDNPEAASPACSAATSTDWSNGWIIFVDINSDGTVDTGDTVIRVQPVLTYSGGIDKTGSTAFDHFTYNVLGRSNANGTLLVKSKGTYSKVNRNLVIDKTGRVRWEVAS